MSKEEVIFVAQDSCNRIAEVKQASFRLLASYTAAFAFLINENIDNTSLLAYLFYGWGGFIILVCSVFYPLKMDSRRKKLQRSYEKFDSDAKEAHGNWKKIAENDAGDYIYIVLALIHIIALMVIFALDPLSNNVLSDAVQNSSIEQTIKK